MTKRQRIFGYFIIVLSTVIFTCFAFAGCGDNPQEESDETNEKPTASLTYKREGNTYTVTGMTGEETVLVIPSKYNGLPVTKIQADYGNGAFASKDITKVILPDTMNEIGQNSFYNCKKLHTVEIGDGSRLTTIGNNAFSGNSALIEFYIPASMVNLGESVFNNCGAIERFTVAEGNAEFTATNGHLIKKNGASLIRGANNGVIPDGVKVICKAAFRKSTATKLTIPASVESIENYVIDDSDIQEIIYQGSEESWEQITKAKLWNLGKTDITIEFIS